MSSTTVKCKYCGKEIDKETAYNPIARQYYCSKEHYDIRERERLGENNKSKKIKYKPQENTDRREFTDYVQSIYVDKYGWDKKKINWSMICSNASNILKEHEAWSYSTLTYILYYMNEIKELNLICDESNYNPLSLLPYYAQEAERYYLETCEIEKSIEEFDFNIETIKVKKRIEKPKKFKEIDMNNL